MTSLRDTVRELRSSPATGGLKAVITGKGGTGKTTLTALLSTALAQAGARVLAVDGDPQMNLPYCLGIPTESGRAIVPLSRQAELIEEKTGARPGSGWGGFLKLNPPVGDVVERFGRSVQERLAVLVMGSVVKSATGCLCPENSLLDAVVRHIGLRKDEAVLLDTQAGVEHFGRAIARGFSHCLIMSDCTFNACSVAAHCLRLARDIDIGQAVLVLNRSGDRGEREMAEQHLAAFDTSPGDFDAVFELPREARLSAFEPAVAGILQGDATSPFCDQVVHIARSLLETQPALES